MFFLRCLQDNITGLPGMSSPDGAVPGSMLPARWDTELPENWDFLRGVFPLRAGPEILLTQETPENQPLQRERELPEASAALALLGLLTKKA